ncbi:MAG TPA: hypothetical protein VMT10_12215 [Solirubrobacteraceae bacterium]|nr:hypothetical protein [Solirubrobacteraceae bacterium]
MLRGFRIAVATCVVVAMFAACAGVAEAKYVVNPNGADVHVTSANGYYDGPYIGWLATGQGFSVNSSPDGVWCLGYASGEVLKNGNVLCGDLNASSAPELVGPLDHGATFHNETVTCASTKLYRNYDPAADNFKTDTGITYTNGNVINVRDAGPYHYRLYGARAVRVYMASRWAFMSANCLSGGTSN